MCIYINIYTRLYIIFYIIYNIIYNNDNEYIYIYNILYILLIYHIYMVKQYAWNYFQTFFYTSRRTLLPVGTSRRTLRRTPENLNLCGDIFKTIFILFKIFKISPLSSAGGLKPSGMYTATQPKKQTQNEYADGAAAHEIQIRNHATETLGLIETKDRL